MTQNDNGSEGDWITSPAALFCKDLLQWLGWVASHCGVRENDFTFSRGVAQRR